MNDVHHNDNLGHPFHSALWRKPELFRQGHPGYFARALDYAHVEVREHYRALIGETLARYDIAGLELDFLREPYLFSKGKEQEGRQILTEWLRGIRTLADAAAKRLGKAKVVTDHRRERQTSAGKGLHRLSGSDARLAGRGDPGRHAHGRDGRPCLGDPAVGRGAGQALSARGLSSVRAQSASAKPISTTDNARSD